MNKRSSVPSVAASRPASSPAAPLPPPAAAGTGAEPPRVGDTLAALRRARSFSLDELSRRAGVSKSMLSQIERNQANPTVAVVWRLSNALGVAIGELLEAGRRAPEPPLTLVPAHGTPSMKSVDAGYELRILGPIDLAGRFEWYQLTIQPGGALRSEAHAPGSKEHLTVLSGTLEVGSGTETERVKHGETVRYAADLSHVIRNAGRVPSTALLVVLHAD